MSTLTRATTQGERLARSRMFAGISQTEIGQLLGKSKTTVSNWENATLHRRALDNESYCTRSAPARRLTAQPA